MKKITLFSITALLFFTFSSFAQWTSDTDVNTLAADSESGDMQAVGTSDGKTFIVFWKNAPAPQNYELRVQLIDADGVQLFGSDGILASDNLPMSTYTSVSTTTIDTENNLYIGATSTENGNAYAYKIDTEGNRIWGNNGLHLGEGNVVTILPLSNGEAIASWAASSGAVMQKINTAGNTVWANPKPVLNGSNTIPGEFYEMSNGDYVAVFHIITFGINSNIYAQRFNADGEPQWAESTQLSDYGTTFIRRYSTAQDGDVMYFGYYASPGFRFDSFLQRINPDGTLPWGINGADFDTNETDYEMETSIAFSEGSDYVWSICTYSDDNQNIFGEYVQKFDKVTGERMFTDSAKQVYALSNEPDIHAGQLQLVNGRPFFLIKSGFDSGVSPITLHGVYLDENGDFAWEEETKPVATFPASKSRIHFTKPVNGQSVAVFVEDKGDGQKIYVQNIVEEDLSVSDVENNIALYYNNPVGNELIIQSNIPLRSIEIFDALGRKVHKSNLSNTQNANISTVHWSSGIYFMNITTQYGKTKGYKLIK